MNHADAGPVPRGARTVRAAAPGATRLVLVRHGEAACHRDGIVGGHQGCAGLTATGRAQALALRDRLVRTRELDGAAALYTSVLPRAVETAALIVDGMDPAPDPVADCGLCELHPGSADGLTWDEFRARFGEPDFDVEPERAVAPGGESWHGFVGRAASAVTSVARSHPDELAVIVCHGGVIEATMLSFLPVAPGRRLTLPTEYTSLTEWEYVEDRWRLMRYNDAAHLRYVVG